MVGKDHGLLGREDPEEGGPSDPRLGRDLVNGRRIETLAREQLEGGFDKAVAGAQRDS
jgi:hypothetical protein